MKGKYIENTNKKITDKAIKEKSIKVFPKGTLLLSFKLSIGKVAFTGKDMSTNEAIVALTPNDETDTLLSEYLYYILPTLDLSPYAQRASKGFTLNREAIEDIEIPYPSKSVRDNIVKEIQKGEASQKTLYEQIENIATKHRRLIYNHTG